MDLKIKDNKSTSTKNNAHGSPMTIQNRKKIGVQKILTKRLTWLG